MHDVVEDRRGQTLLASVEFRSDMWATRARQKKIYQASAPGLNHGVMRLLVRRLRECSLPFLGPNLDLTVTCRNNFISGGTG